MVYNRQLLLEIVRQIEIGARGISKYFGWPRIPGMPPLYDLDNRLEARKMLKQRYTSFPPDPNATIPTGLKEVFFGRFPKLSLLRREFFQSEDGYFNFYIENFSTSYFLPDFISRFIQLRFEICTDTTVLEIIREVLFLFIFFVYSVISFRTFIAWFININPYTIPWNFLTFWTDLIEENLEEYFPSILGANYLMTALVMLLGKIGDGLNHLVFTFPYLPSEGVRKIVEDQHKTIVQSYYIFFEGLPKLWEDYPIPNDLREFWYYERPDVTDFMNLHFPNVNVLPDELMFLPFPPDNIIS